MLEVDYKNGKLLGLSGDAFWSLFLDESPLDEESQAVIKRVQAKFPNGFLVDSDYEIDEEDGTVLATFYPYVLSDFRADYTSRFTKTCCVQAMKLEGNKLLYRWYDEERGELSRGESEIQINQFKKCFFKTEGGSIIFI